MYTYASTVTLFSELWKSGGGEHAKVRVFELPTVCETYKQMYDTLKGHLRKLCGYDDFVTGILSKRNGQTLRVAAVYNALFSIDNLTH